MLKMIRWVLIAISGITVIAWALNWIVAKEFIEPLDRNTLFGVLANGAICGFMIPSKLQHRAIGALLGTIISYALMMLVYFYNAKMYSAVT